MHLSAPVPDERVVKLVRQLAGMFDERVDDRLQVLASPASPASRTHLTLNQRRDLAVATFKDQLPFPMTRHRPIFG